MRKLLLTIVFVVAFVSSASAGTIIIDFATGSALVGGTITYSGSGVHGDQPLVGSNIGIGQVGRTDVPLGPYVVTGTNGGWGVLSFTTGKFNTYIPSLHEYLFSPGGSLTIVGGVPSAGIPNGTVLLSAPLISAVYTSKGALSLAIAAGSDTKNATLLAFLGVSGNPQFNFSGTVHAQTITGGTGKSLTGVATISTDIVNSATVVPEPGASVLLGVGLIALAFIGRRFF